MSSAKWRPFCLGINVLIQCSTRLRSYHINISDKDEEEVTYCVVCQVECKTPGGFFSHTKSMSHIIRASESGAMETVQDRQSDGM